MKEKLKGELYIGPAGWSYKDWVGPVYPVGARIDQLATIARYFDCIELNSSFYRTPGSRLVESWSRRLTVNLRFKLTVKVWQRFTHERKIEGDDIKRYIHSFDPLLDAGRIGAFLLQFPWSFRNDAENRKYIETLSGAFRDHPTAVELRHGSWNEAVTLDLLSGCGLALCNIDQPQIGDSMPPTDHVTVPGLGYIRLHGRNRENWFKKSAGRDERYDYLYSENELEEWKERAGRILSKVAQLFIITNNHFRGQALANACQLRFLLERKKPVMPATLISAFHGLEEISEVAGRQGELL